MEGAVKHVEHVKHVKHMVMAALVAASAVAVAAQTPASKASPTTKSKAAANGSAGSEGHTAPKTQPTTAPAPAAPAGEIALGLVHLGKGVKADGKPLAAGTYRVRLTAQSASPAAKGESEGLERWVEFVQGREIKGREVVTIIPQSEINLVQKDAPPRANASKVELLKGGEFLRVWINKGGNHYLLHLPTA
jgi:hypothetical protein